MNQLKVVPFDGQLVTISRDVAEMIGREHGVILRTIRGFIKLLAQDNFVVSDFFLESNYKDQTGRTLPCYMLTLKGCHLVANKMTGEKGILFTAAYVTKFEEMEKKNYLPGIPLDNVQLTEKMLETTQELEDIKANFKVLHEKIDNQITLDHGEQRLLQQLISKKVYDLALSNEHKRVLFAELYREIKDRFGVSSYKDVKQIELQRAISYIEAWIPRKRNLG